MLTPHRPWIACCLLFLVPCVWAAEPDYSQDLPRIEPTSPQQALSTFRVKDGYRLELAASEPLLSSPVAVCWDEQGRMFVVEMRGYSEHRDEGLSQIRLVIDDDNDGKYDRSTVFADKLLWPTAIACWDGGVFIADAPDILYLKDTDNDGIADVRKRVFTGFGTQNVQGLLNSFHWTFDNRIHGSASSNGGEITVVDKPNAKPVSVRGRDFSFDPRTLDFRAESGGAQHGLTFDDYGRKLVSSNSDHVQQVMYEDRYIARNPRFAAPGARVSIAADGPQAEVFRISPVEPWRIIRTRLRVTGAVPGVVEGGGRAAGYFTGATGVTVVRGSAFKDDPMRGMIVVGDVGSNLVHRKTLRLQGVQYVAERVDKESEFIASKDNWFRPAQYANGPDGALYVIDVYREVIEHPHSIPPIIKKHLDLDSGRDRGRIYRVAPKDWQRAKVPRLDRMTTPELVALLQHENAWHRETAARLLFERRDEAAVAPLVELASAKAASSLGRIHALYMLAGLDKHTEKLVLAALGSSNPRVREHAVRLSERFLPNALPIAAKLAELIDDEDAQVRYQLAFTLGELPEEARVRPLVQLLKKHSSDRWLQAACLSSLQDGVGRALVELLREENTDKDIITLARLLASQVARQSPERVATTVKSLLETASPNHPALPVALHTIVKQSRSSVNKTASSPEFAAMERILASSRQQAKEAILDPQCSTTDKINALEFLTLAPFAETKDCFTATLLPQSPRELQLAALRTLGEIQHSEVGAVIVEAWNSLTPQSRRAAVDVLMSRPERIKELLAAVKTRQISPGEVDRTQIELLKKQSNAEIRRQAEELFAATANRASVVEQYKGVLEKAGDAVRGKELFAKNCAACHRAEGIGHELAPNLAAMKNRGPEAILLNVLDPNREVNPQFLSYVVVTTEGKTLTGVIAAESAAGITLKRADGQGDEVLRSDIEELRSTGLSLMPEGLERQIDQNAMADIIAYVMSLK